MRNEYLIINAAVALALLLLGVSAFISNRKVVLNQLFLAFTVCIGVWLVSAAVSNDTTNSAMVSLYGNYLVFSFSYFTSYLLLWFTALITSMQKVIAILRLLLIPVVIVGLLSATPSVVAGVDLDQGVYGVKFGPLIVLYAFVLFIMLFGTLAVLAKGLRRATGRNKDQISVLLLCLGIAIPVLLATQFILPALTGSFGITDTGILAMILPVVGLYFSVIRHRLFDIKLAAVRTIVYVLALATLAMIYYFAAYVISRTLFNGQITTTVSFSPLNVLLALLLAFIFQPIKNFFDRITNRIFYRDSYNSEEFFARLSDVLSTTTELRGLLERAATEIGSTLKAAQAFFYVRYENDRHMNAGTQNHQKLDSTDIEVIEAFSKKNKHRLIITENLTSDEELYKILASRAVALLLPLIQAGQIVGYLALGEQQGSRYTNRDMKVLTAIVDELVIAIQNALNVEEVRDVNIHLQQRIDSATKELRSSNRRLTALDETKDEFISMASHQLRTPLTSVKGYISMILDGDAGKINDKQRRFLSEAFDSSNRMAGIISDFLNVSRLQTGKFEIEKEPVNLADLVESEVEHLRNAARLRGVELVYDKPRSFTKAPFDKSKIEQVIMNFIDNAIFYAANGKVINIELYQRGGNAVLKVKDHGIGVPKEEQAHLFTKFFRATNARHQRPDGTGVGLFLAKKVIVAHGGVVLFESTEGRGSMFGFELPLLEQDVNQFENKPDHDHQYQHSN